jgi:tetratricopeptide (TPR) repeat protein
LGFMPPVSQNDLNQALTAHQEGRLGEAEKCYRQLAEAAPENADVWHLLGALCHQIGDITQAEQYLDRAIELEPDFAEALNSRGIFLKDNRRLLAAEQDFKAALTLIPHFPQSLTNLADIYRLKGNFTEAKTLNDRALKLAPDLAPAYNNLGAIERDLSNLEAACEAFQKALELDQTLIDAAINLALTLNTMGKTTKALQIATEASQQAPDYAPAQNCLGTIYFECEKFENASICFKDAITLDPAYADGHNNLANTLTKLGNMPEAHKNYDVALQVSPENPNYWANKAAAFQAENKIDDALSAVEKALNIQPDHADATWNRAIARLISGDLAAGFTDYEARWRLPEFKRRKIDSLLWQGESLAGKTLLLYSEQGFGDTLQFIRYVSLLAAQNPKAIYLETHEPLRNLLSQTTEISQIYVRGEALPKSDYHLPIMGLAHLCGTTLATIPRASPYLNAPTDKIATFSIDSDSETKLKIGLVWAGRPTHKNDRNRSLSLSSLKPVTENKRVQFYSLQLGEAQNDLAAQSAIIDKSSYLTDFAATATLINQLDLVITVDTAVAHLAGALGAKCWVLLPFAPDWRWFLDRNDSPWYPSLTLFRQSNPGEWEPVIAEIAQALGAIDHS